MGEELTPTYGYSTERLAPRHREQMEEYSRRAGIDLMAVFAEKGADCAAFGGLLCELHRSRARHVLTLAALDTGRRNRLEREADAVVHVTHPETLPQPVGPSEHIRLAPLPTAAQVALLRTRLALSRWQLVELQPPVEHMVAELVDDLIQQMPPIDPRVGWAYALEVCPVSVTLTLTPERVLVNVETTTDLTLTRIASVSRAADLLRM